MIAIYPLRPPLQTADVITALHSPPVQRDKASRATMRPEGKSRFASRVSSLLCLLAMAAIMPLAPTLAQDSEASEPAPVLRGFRLDPDRAKPEPPPPTTTLPPPSETQTRLPAQVRPTQQPQARPSETRPAQTRSTPATAEDAATNSDDATTQSAEPVLANPTEASPAPETSTVEPTVVPANSDADSGLWWKLAAAAAALGVVLAGIWWLRRQSRRESQPESNENPDIRENIAVAPVTPTPPKPAPPPPIAKPAIRKPDVEPPVLLEFLPDRAVVSINNLSVTGKLRLTNTSDQPIGPLRLRVGLIGASADQAEIISAFHAREDGKEQPLDDLKPGQKQAFDIEMALPLADMPSYVVGSQRLLVPIVIANLAYGNGGNAQVEMACIVGREANPPQPKLGPLRLDLGPRSFAPLGQRLLAA